MRRIHPHAVQDLLHGRVYPVVAAQQRSLDALNVLGVLKEVLAALQQRRDLLVRVYRGLNLWSA